MYSSTDTFCLIEDSLSNQSAIELFGLTNRTGRYKWPENIKFDNCYWKCQATVSNFILESVGTEECLKHFTEGEYIFSPDHLFNCTHWGIYKRVAC